jgi:hypothetical protein|tara:strand:+ start:778 stop:1359 length:582 start_codon:yes stop_codon:yes gene_type:complete
VKYLPLAGTWRAVEDRWCRPGSPFDQIAAQHQLERVGRELRFWSTALSGTRFCGSKHLAWQFGGEQVVDYTEDEDMGDELIIIAHSHGGQVAAYALANDATCDTLITVDTPIRRDMEEVWRAGTPNRRRHLHLYGTGWGSRMRIFGQRRFKREMPWATKNLRIDGGHSGILADAEHRDQWHEILSWATDAEAA